MVCATALDGVNEDCIGVVVIENKDVVHATTGANWETSREVSCYQSFEAWKLERRWEANAVGSVEVGTGRVQGRFNWGFCGASHALWMAPHLAHDGWDAFR